MKRLLGAERIEMKLTDAQLEKLRWLNERGGSGVLDRYGRMVAAGEAGHPAWQQSWLNLVAKGLLSGGNDRLTITEAGRIALQ